MRSCRGSPGHVILCGLVFKTIKLYLLAVAVAQATPLMSQFKIKRLFKHDVCVSTWSVEKQDV